MHSLLDSRCLLCSSTNLKDFLLNANGRHLLGLFNDFGLIILNGQDPGDRCGEYSFAGQRDSSVIDFCAVPCDLLSCVSDFRVGDEIFQIIFQLG